MTSRFSNYKRMLISKTTEMKKQFDINKTTCIEHHQMVNVNVWDHKHIKLHQNYKHTTIDYQPLHFSIKVETRIKDKVTLDYLHVPFYNNIQTTKSTHIKSGITVRLPIFLFVDLFWCNSELDALCNALFYSSLICISKDSKMQVQEWIRFVNKILRDR